MPLLSKNELLRLFVVLIGTSAIATDVVGADTFETAPRLHSIDAGDVLTVDVVPNLPLTPPPGVQQSAALRGWSARLSREALASMTEETRFFYELRLLRIRPTTGSSYEFDWMTPPWMAPGVYDLEIRGPGVAQIQQGVVRIADPLAAEPLAEMLIPGHVEAVQLKADGEVVLPRSVTFADNPSAGCAGRRLVRFSPPSSAPIVGEAVEARHPCRVSISWPRQQDVPLDVHDEIRVVASGAVTVAFDLAMERWSSGFSVRHLWLLSRQPHVEVHTLDNLARCCAASRTGRFHRPLHRSSCQASPASPPLSFPFLLFLRSLLSF